MAVPGAGWQAVHRCCAKNQETQVSGSREYGKAEGVQYKPAVPGMVTGMQNPRQEEAGGQAGVNGAQEPNPGGPGVGVRQARQAVHRDRAEGQGSVVRQVFSRIPGNRQAVAQTAVNSGV